MTESNKWAKHAMEAGCGEVGPEGYKCTHHTYRHDGREGIFHVAFGLSSIPVPLDSWTTNGDRETASKLRRYAAALETPGDLEHDELDHIYNEIIAFLLSAADDADGGES